MEYEGVQYPDTEAGRAYVEAAVKSDRAQAASDGNLGDEGLYEAAEKAYEAAYWAHQALPVEFRYPADRFEGKDDTT